MTAPDPLTAYYATEYHRRNMQVARVCGAQAAVDQALERALTIKSIPNWMIAYLESAAQRLPGLQHDLAAWRDLAPDAPEHVRADPAVILAAARELPEVKALEAERDRLRAALEQIAEPCSVSVSDRTGLNGITWRAMYEAWRAICVERVDIARAALTTKGEADARP